MAELVRYSRQIGASLPRISVNRPTFEPPATAGLADAINDFLTVGQEDRVRANIEEAQSLARDTELGFETVYFKGKSERRVVAPEFRDGGSRADIAYNDILRSRYLQEQSNLFAADIGNIRAKTPADPEAFRSAARSYQETLGFEPGTLFGSELAKQIEANANLVTAEKSRQVAAQAKAAAIVDLERAYRDDQSREDSGDQNIEKAKQNVLDTGGTVNDIERIRDNYDQEVTRANLKALLDPLNDSTELQKKWIELQNDPEGHIKFGVSKTVFDLVIPQIAQYVNAKQELESRQNTDEINKAINAFGASSNRLQTAYQNGDRTAIAVARSEIVESAKAFKKALENPSLKPALFKSFSEVYRKYSELLIQASQYDRTLAQEVNDIIRWQVAADALRASFINEVSQQSLDRLDSFRKAVVGIGDEYINGKDPDDATINAIRTALSSIDAQHRQIAKALKDVNDAERLLTPGGRPSDWSNSDTDTKKADHIQRSYADYLVEMYTMQSPEDELATSFNVMAGIAFDTPVQTLLNDAKSLPPEIKTGTYADLVRTPKAIAAMANQIRILPTDVKRALLDISTQDVSQLSLPQVMWVSSVVNELKAYQVGLAAIGVPTKAINLTDDFSSYLLSEPDFEKALAMYKANWKIPSETERMTNAQVWTRLIQESGKSLSDLVSKVENWNNLTPSNQNEIINTARAIARRFGSAKLALHEASIIFFSAHRKSMTNLDEGQFNDGQTRFAKFPINAIDKEAGLDGEGTAAVAKHISDIDPSYELGKNVFLRFRDDPSGFGRRGTYFLVKAESMESGDRPNNPAIVEKNGVPVVIDAIGIMRDVSKRLDKENVSQMMKRIDFMQRVREGQSDINHPQLRALRKSIGQPELIDTTR